MGDLTFCVVIASCVIAAYFVWTLKNKLIVYNMKHQDVIQFEELEQLNNSGSDSYTYPCSEHTLFPMTTSEEENDEQMEAESITDDEDKTEHIALIVNEEIPIISRK